MLHNKERGKRGKGVKNEKKGERQNREARQGKKIHRQGHGEMIKYPQAGSCSSGLFCQLGTRFLQTTNKHQQKSKSNPCHLHLSTTLSAHTRPGALSDPHSSLSLPGMPREATPPSQLNFLLSSFEEACPPPWSRLSPSPFFFPSLPPMQDCRGMEVSEASSG